jgi:hypothetical protein
MTAGIAGLITVAAAVVLATAPANEATARAPEALPAAPTRLALPATPVPQPAAADRPVAAHSTDRVIWWGAPPIWRPPDRAPAVPVARPSAGRPLAGASAAQLTWSPPPREPRFWGEPQPSDADTVEAPRRATPPSPRRPWPPHPAEPAWIEQERAEPVWVEAES